MSRLIRGFSPTLQGFHVCLVDDNPTNLLVLQHYCETYGIRWESAHDGLDSPENQSKPRGIEEISFDLVICDMKLPGHEWETTWSAH